MDTRVSYCEMFNKETTMGISTACGWEYTYFGLGNITYAQDPFCSLLGAKRWGAQNEGGLSTGQNSF